jgi:hypothetical protein
MAVLEVIIIFPLIAAFNHPLNFAIARRSWPNIPARHIAVIVSRVRWNLRKIYFDVPYLESLAIQKERWRHRSLFL